MKIFCLDDDKNSRELISYAVTNHAMVCSTFKEINVFFDALETEKPDLIVMDIDWPEDNGMVVLRRLKDHAGTAAIPIIILSARASEYDRITGLDAGADDFMAKPFSALELISRIKAVLRRSGIRNEELLTIGDIVVNRTSHRVFVADAEISLTNREYQLLSYLMENAGVLIHRDTLLHQVWGFDFGAETRTVDVHIRYLRQKLGESGRLIETVRGAGYRIGGNR